MYQILEGFALMDWWSPLLTIIRNVIYHPTHSFFIPYHCGRSGNEIARLLKTRGIRSWAHLAINGTFMFTVRRRHAGLAQLILDQAGVPIRHGRIQASGTRPRPRRMQPKAAGLLADIDAWLDDALDAF